MKTQQKHLFYNSETGEAVIATMEDVITSGTPIDAESGDDLDYIGPAIYEGKQLLFVNDEELYVVNPFDGIVKILHLPTV